MKFAKVLMKALKREISGTKQFYTEIFNKEEVRLLQSDKNPVKIKQNNERKYKDDT